MRDSNTVFIVAVAAICDKGIALMPMVVYAQSKEDAEMVTLAAAREQVFPLIDGWHDHYAEAQTVDMACKATEVNPDMTIKATWELRDRIEQKKAEAGL